MEAMIKLGRNAKHAARQLAVLGREKNDALMAAADALQAECETILEANQLDLSAAREAGMAAAKLDRLLLDEVRIHEMAEAIRKVAGEPDPIGRILDGERRPNGLVIERVSVPLGVVGIIYESRPNVTSDAAALCIKAGNAVLLRGGKEAIHSNTAIVQVMRSAFQSASIPADSLQLVTDTSRASAQAMMGLSDYLDVLIPRGSAGLIQMVKAHAHVPVIETGVGNCHVYVDASADVDMAVEIIYNAKTSRPSVCNAIETVLVHQTLAHKLLPRMKARLNEKQVQLRGDQEVCTILSDAVAASESDWSEEFSDYILAVKCVNSLDEAIGHIAKYSSGHSESIITTDLRAAKRFTAEVDSAAVYVNASTRFTDGGMFGLGAEIGISTQKLHARGPMGLAHLTSYKYIINGDGQVR